MYKAMVVGWVAAQPAEPPPPLAGAAPVFQSPNSKKSKKKWSNTKRNMQL